MDLFIELYYLKEGIILAIIKITEVVPGMILNKDVYIPKKNAIALSAGAILSKAHINRLKKLNVNRINVLVENKHLNNKSKRDRFFENHNKLKYKLELLFNQIRIGKKFLISDIDHEVCEMIKSISTNNNILSRLRQLDDSGSYLINHSVNVSLLASTIGKLLGYSSDKLKNLLITGIFHDVGMLKVPEKIMNKPGPLSEEEFIVIINHTINSYKILKGINNINSEVLYGVLEHHEREDGSGYPLGLKSNQIHEFGKIIAIADVFHAMTTDKIYRKRKSPFIAAEEMLYNSFGILDGEITTTFLNNISKFYIGNIVRLNDGSIGEIIYTNKAIPTRPVVNINGNFVDLLKNKEYEIIDIID